MPSVGGGAVGFSLVCHLTKFGWTDAAQSLAAGGAPVRLHGFVVEARDDDVTGDEPVFLHGDVCGRVFQRMRS